MTSYFQGVESVRKFPGISTYSGSGIIYDLHFPRSAIVIRQKKKKQKARSQESEFAPPPPPPSMK
jgi:hypothetical protein